MVPRPRSLASPFRSVRRTTLKPPWLRSTAVPCTGAIALCELPLLRVPHSWYQRVATWQFDPDGSFAAASQLLPATRAGQAAMESAIAAGACGFVGVLTGYPGNSREYYVPYDGKPAPNPGRLDQRGRWRTTEVLARRGSRRSQARGRRSPSINHLIQHRWRAAGADHEAVIVGSHHDGPWASAVEDGSGIALVLAQAAYWSRVPPAERPHRLMFLLNGGHMSGGAGQADFVLSHRAELDHVVLEVHLEHAAQRGVGSGRRAASDRTARNTLVVHVAHPAPGSCGARSNRG